MQVDQTDLGRGDPIEFRAFVGEDLEGNEQIYSDRAVRAFRGVLDGDVLDIETRQGDRPIGKIRRAKNGLYVAALMTNANVLTYQELEEFNRFAVAHGNDFAVQTHLDRGFPAEKFKESYFRFAKALVKVGDGEGRDQATGMPYELVALTNPHTDQGPVRMLLLFKGKPVADQQVDVFFRAAGAEETTKSSLETNALGEVVFETEPGFYLVNAVRLEEPDARIKEALGVVWQSLWASLTFRIE